MGGTVSCVGMCSAGKFVGETAVQTFDPTVCLHSLGVIRISYDPHRKAVAPSRDFAVL